MRRLRRVHLLLQLGGRQLRLPHVPLLAGARRHAQGRPRRLRRHAVGAARDGDQGLYRLPVWHDGAVPVHGRLVGHGPRQHSARLHGVRQQGPLRPLLGRVRLLPRLRGRGLPARVVPGPALLGPRLVSVGRRPRLDGQRQHLPPLGPRRHHGLQVRAWLCRTDVRGQGLQVRRRPALHRRPVHVDPHADGQGRDQERHPRGRRARQLPVPLGHVRAQILRRLRRGLPDDADHGQLVVR
mmetsp:Transcript_18160/g.62686  ORF Transcript_18160/g.62686 Transcript_18160/m.62686 type:complete len:239 (+) Transcript_18160:165-881(+)